MRRRRSSCRASFRCAAAFLDIFAPDAEDPVRIELFGDEVESIRRFDVATQRSLATLEATTITLLEPTASDRAHFTSYLPAGTWFMLIEPNELAEEGKFYLERMDRPQAFHAVRPTLEEIYKFPSVTASGVPSGSMETTAHLEFESVERFSGEIAKVRDELDKVSEGHEVFVVCETDAEIERLGELFKNSKLMGGGGRALGRASQWHPASWRAAELDAGHASVAFCGRAFGGWVSDCAAAGCAGECGGVVSAAGFGADDAAAAGAGDR